VAKLEKSVKLGPKWESRTNGVQIGEVGQIGSELGK